MPKRPSFIEAEEWCYITDFAVHDLYISSVFSRLNSSSMNLVLAEKLESRVEMLFPLYSNISRQHENFVTMKDVIIEFFVEQGIVSLHEDKYAGNAYRLAVDLESYISSRKTDLDSCLHRADRDGYSVIHRGFANIVEKYADSLIPDSWNWVVEEGASSRSNAQLPAADRIVSLDHNSSAYKQAIDAISDLETEVSKSNEQLFDAPEELESWLAELRSTKELLKARNLKLSVIKEKIMPVLQYAADNFVRGALGALGAAAVVAVLALL